MPANENQWDHIGPLAQKPDASNFNEGYTYLANDAAVGYAVAVGHRTGERYWQQIFCQCWTDITPVCSIKNISLTNQTLPPVYGSVTIPPGQSIILQDDPQWASYTLRSNGISLSNFAIGFLLQDCPLDAAVYVDGNIGNDANPGTQSLPVATVRQAFRIWPNQYARSCNMFITGTTQESPDDLIVYPPQPIGPDAQPPCIIGTMQDVGLGTLTVQSFALNGSPTAVSAGDSLIPTTHLPLSFDLYAGQECYMTSGSISGRAYTIMNNSTGSFFLPHASHDGLPAPGDTFVVRQPASGIAFNGGQFKICGGRLAMYGLNITQLPLSFSFLSIDGSQVYADNVRLTNMYTIIIGEGILAPGLAHDVCKFSGAPSVSPSVMGIYTNVNIEVLSGSLGAYWGSPLGGLINGVLVMRGGGALIVEQAGVNLYVADLQRVYCWQALYFSVIEHWRINGSTGIGFFADNSPMLSISQVDISNCVSDAISLDDGSVMSGSVISGSSNGGVGVRTAHGAKATVAGITITGTGGNAIVGSNAADTWTNIATGNAAHTTDWNASSIGVATSQGCRVGP